MNLCHALCNASYDAETSASALWREEEDRRKDYAVVDMEESLWSLDEEEDASGQAIKLLMITIVKPPLSEDEIMWKKGDRRRHPPVES